MINNHVSILEVEELSETLSDDPPTVDYHHDPLLAMVHDSLNLPAISDSSDIAQLLSVNKSSTQKDSKHLATVHRQDVFARAKTSASHSLTGVPMVV